MFSSTGAGGTVELDCDGSANRLGPAFSPMSPMLGGAIPGLTAAYVYCYYKIEFLSYKNLQLL